VRLKAEAKISDQSLNHQAAQLAARFGVPGAAGSDAHDPDGIGAAYLEMPDFDGPRDFLAPPALGVASTSGLRSGMVELAPRGGLAVLLLLALDHRTARG
jgi:PHP-associated